MSCSSFSNLSLDTLSTSWRLEERASVVFASSETCSMTGSMFFVRSVRVSPMIFNSAVFSCDVLPKAFSSSSSEWQF